MIKISVDESAAFDALSILYVKNDISPRDGLKKQIEILLSDIQESIGFDRMSDIICSDEYNILEKSNKEIFLLIDRLRSGEKMDAKIIDDANTERFKAKKVLQEKFWGTELSEVKFFKGKD